MFTHVKSTIRHIAPDNLRGRSLIKVVYVVLESQYQSALSQAVRSINQNHPNLAIEISGYLVEELLDPENYEGFKREIADADIFIGSAKSSFGVSLEMGERQQGIILRQ